MGNGPWFTARPIAFLRGLDRLERELGVVQDAAETAEARNVGLLD
jgi:hypothetical protein